MEDQQKNTKMLSKLGGETVYDPATLELTAAIASHVAATANARPTEADMEAVRRLLLDNFVVSLWGSTRPWTQQIVQWTRCFAGTGLSPVLGGTWATEASIAAMVHGTAAHSYELDDTHDETLSHPGSAIIPAALAVAAQSGATQADLVRAVTAGYEAMTLIGSAAGGLETVHRGFHPTSVFGSFGAATACVCLHAFDRSEPVRPETLIAAWGHALSQACGVMQFSTEPAGGEVKRVHAGFGARNGVFAAALAHMPAVTAPQRIVEGTYGLAALFGGPLRTVTPAEQPQIHNISLKPYSCCRLFHSTIDALAQVTEQFRTPPATMVEIVISGPQLIADQHMLPHPESTMAAQFSCPYIVGATLAYGPQRYDAYGDDYLNDPAILAIAAKVRFELSEELTRKYYPTRFATGVKIRFADGTVKSSIVVDSLGTPRKPLTRDQIIAKGEGLGSRVGPRLAECIWNSSHDARALADALTGQ